MWFPVAAADDRCGLQWFPVAAADGRCGLQWFPVAAADERCGLQWFPVAAADERCGLQWFPVAAADERCGLQWFPVALQWGAVDCEADHSNGAMTMPIGAGGFNPNDPMYRNCCCHTKTFTIVTGILEIFTICFVLVAIIPDVNSRICDVKKNSTVAFSMPSNFTTTESPSNMLNATDEYKHFMSSFRQGVCDLNVGWLAAAIADILSVNLMFYAIKSVRWILFFPHIFFRTLVVFLFIGGVALEVYAVIEGGSNPSSMAVAVIFTVIGALFWIFITIAEIRCAHFVKRSQETGYSISVARPIGPATISLSEREQQQQQQQPQAGRSALPPLRHTYGGRDPSQKYADA